MLVSKYFVWFIIYSFMGWIYESTYCTIRKHHWENRGFLHGPIVPIYGVGALLASILFSEFPISGMQEASNLKIFLICFFGSIVLEYTTSWALEKLFHAYWWEGLQQCYLQYQWSCLPAGIHRLWAGRHSGRPRHLSFCQRHDTRYQCLSDGSPVAGLYVFIWHGYGSDGFRPDQFCQELQPDRKRDQRADRKCLRKTGYQGSRCHRQHDREVRTDPGERFCPQGTGRRKGCRPARTSDQRASGKSFPILICCTEKYPAQYPRLQAQ